MSPRAALHAPSAAHTAGPYRLNNVPLANPTRLSTVYRGTHEATGAEAAIKVLHDRDKPNATLRRESALLDAITHPNVVRSLGSGLTSRNEWYVATEFLPGLSLDRLVGAKGPASWQLACKIGLQACSAMQATHDAGIVHRDIKLANLMANRSQGQLHVTLFDFGIADYLADPEEADETYIVGTPSYLAPECWRGSHASVQSDLYALGVTLYRLTHGKAPFATKDIDQLAEMHLGAPVPIDSNPRHIPPALQSLLHDLMAKSPANRPRSAADVGLRLAATLQ